MPHDTRSRMENRSTARTGAAARQLRRNRIGYVGGIPAGSRLCAARAQSISEVIAHESANHVHVDVGKVDQFQYPVDHCVTERNQRIDCAQRDTVN